MRTSTRDGVSPSILCVGPRTIWPSHDLHCGDFHRIKAGGRVSRAWTQNGVSPATFGAGPRTIWPSHDLLCGDFDRLGLGSFGSPEFQVSCATRFWSSWLLEFPIFILKPTGLHRCNVVRADLFSHWPPSLRHP